MTDFAILCTLQAQKYSFLCSLTSKNLTFSCTFHFFYSTFASVFEPYYILIMSYFYAGYYLFRIFTCSFSDLACINLLVYFVLPWIFFYTSMCLFYSNFASKKTQPLFLLHSSVRTFIFVWLFYLVLFSFLTSWE